MLLPDRPSRLRKLLFAPATLVYAAGCAAHRAMMGLNRAHDESASRLPLIVIGSLRAGGAGKTPVALQLARELAQRGYRTGILVYAVAKPESGWDATGLREVHPDSDWQASSDEAVMLSRELAGRKTGVRVFATRDRAAARRTLARAGDLDVLVSDDGLMDARLHGGPAARILRVALVRPGDNPGLWDLLPAGAWRLPASTLRSSRRVHVTLREDDSDGYARSIQPPPDQPLPAPGAPHPEVSSPPVWVLAGLGNPEDFVRRLRAAGWNVVGATFGPDHGLPDLRAAVKGAFQAGGAAGVTFVCSAKDAVKLEGNPLLPADPVIVRETVTLSTGFLERVRGFLATPSS